MKIKDHVTITNLIFGDGYDHVHKWIDSDAKNWFGTEYSPYRHWIKNHHMKALFTKAMEDGNEVEFEVGKLHILCDWLSHFGEWAIPRDSEHVEWYLKAKKAFW